MDIRCTKHVSRLSVTNIWHSEWTSNYQHPHQHGFCICTRWTYHLYPQQNKKSIDNMLPVDVLTPSQQDIAKANAPLPLSEVNSKYRKQIHSVNISPNNHSMAKNLTMKLTLSYTSIVSFTNMPWMPLKMFSTSHPLIMEFHSIHQST